MKHENGFTRELNTIRRLFTVTASVMIAFSVGMALTGWYGTALLQSIFAVAGLLYIPRYLERYVDNPGQCVLCADKSIYRDENGYCSNCLAKQGSVPGDDVDLLALAPSQPSSAAAQVNHARPARLSRCVRCHQLRQSLHPRGHCATCNHAKKEQAGGESNTGNQQT